MATSFKTTVVARIGSTFVKPEDANLKSLTKIINGVLELDDLDAQSYAQYEKDMKEIAELCFVDVEQLNKLIPDLEEAK